MAHRYFPPKKNKFKAVRQTYDGYSYHSKMEAQYAFELDLRKKAKEIKDWERQVKISLESYGKHICNYYIDFLVHNQDGTREYVEVKGMETDVWRMKWKMFEAKMAETEPRAKLTIIRKVPAWESGPWS